MDTGYVAGSIPADIATDTAEEHLLDDHALNLAGADVGHELLVADALGVPTCAFVLVDLDRTRFDAEIVMA